MFTKSYFGMKNILRENVLMIAIVTVLFLTSCQSKKLSQKEELAEINIKDSVEMQVGFVMKIQDIFTIKDVGVAVTGVPIKGTVAEGESAFIIQEGKDSNMAKPCKIVKIHHLDGEDGNAYVGQNVGLILEGISSYDIKMGGFIATFAY